MAVQRVIGLLHPGEMGAAVGRCLTGRGHTVLWASAGRSPQTAGRARAAGLTDAGTVTALASQADMIISICPPHAAAGVARSASQASTAGRRSDGTPGGLFVDANAVSPATARHIGEIVTAAGTCYVDGGIIGPPPLRAGSTRLYLSGQRADEVRALFDGTPLDARVLDGDAASASAIKMAYAAWTKGSAALLLTARALASAAGVEDALAAEWQLSQPDLGQRSRGSARSAVAKGWRWIAEMEQIAESMAAAGLPDGFHQAAAEIFRRCSAVGQAEDAEVSDVVAALAGNTMRDG
jgi:3-hydroxyisobutyrate dehydrogenase-like beta-hydroxyacid dehydrogenase